MNAPIMQRHGAPDAVKAFVPTTFVTAQEIDRRWNLVDNLDLAAIRDKLMSSPPEGEGWDDQTVDVGLLWYRRYLKLHVKYPEYRIVPNKLIDKVWHAHILDTRAYAADCERAFGHFFHHNPYFGAGDEATIRDREFEITDTLYLREFGETSKMGTALTTRGTMCDCVCDISHEDRMGDRQ